MGVVHFVTSENSVPWYACNPGGAARGSKITYNPRLVTCGNCRRWLDARPALVAQAERERAR